MQYFKSNLGVYPSKLQDKKWAAAWARVTLQKVVKIDSLMGEAFLLSKRLLLYYTYYLVKYRLYNRFSKTKFY